MGSLFSAADVGQVKAENVQLMTADKGYDITIVCCSDSEQARYWQERLEAAKGRAVPSESTVVAVDEDWPGGAGNFLGTLYAWTKACAALEAKDRDLKAELKAGKSVALFHTAGKGTRLAPLPGAENNNKPGVKLPVPGGSSILESVIRQTGAYAGSRGGRLSVFWGDQIFVPSVSAAYTPQHHADICCALGPMPSAEEWQARGLDKYGCIAATADNTVIKQLEKVGHAEASAQLEGRTDVERVGPSLGSFSLSADFLEALEGGFSAELSKKDGKMDSDPHLWMAMTLAEDAYAALMVKKEVFTEGEAKAHHARVTKLISEFSSPTCSGMFGAVDVGMDMSWWDYGMLKLFAKNALLLMEDSEDAALARQFFGIAESPRVCSDSSLGACDVDEKSVASGTTAKSGKITASVTSDVCCQELTADSAVLVGVYAKKIVAGKGSVAYNIVDESEEGIVLRENEVRVGVFTLQDDWKASTSWFGSAQKGLPYFEMKSNVQETDGGKVFKTKVHGNIMSFQEVYDFNQGVDVTACAAKAKAAKERFRAALK